MKDKAEGVSWIGSRRILTGRGGRTPSPIYTSLNRLLQPHLSFPLCSCIQPIFECLLCAMSCLRCNDAQSRQAWSRSSVLERHVQAKECILSSFLSPVKEANRTHREERGWWGSLTGIRQRPPCDVRFEPRLRNEEERTFSRQNIMQTGLEVEKGLGCQNTRRNQCPAQLGDNVAPPEVGEAGGSRADGTG